MGWEWVPNIVNCSIFYLNTWRRQWQLTPVLLPGKPHGWSLVGCSPWGRDESDTAEQLHFHFSLSCIGEGNGNPLQCPSLENPRDGGAWWAALYGVAQSQTRLKRLSRSSSYLNPGVTEVSLIFSEFLSWDLWILMCQNVPLPLSLKNKRQQPGPTF